MRSITGVVFDFKRMSVNDGPGIRTTVFLKGCPLCCLWCHNPESQQHGTELSATSNAPSPQALMAIRDFNNLPPRLRNGASAREALVGFPEEIEAVGCTMQVGEVVENALEDRAFFERSGGGVTISGGEPLAQPRFALALLEALHREGVHTLLDTCGVADASTLLATLPFTQLYHYDVKATDDDLHRKLTGAPLAPILANLKRLSAGGADIILRCPIIPGCNDHPDHLRAIGKIAESHVGVRQIELMPYHDTGLSKYARLGRKPPCGVMSFPYPESLTTWLNTTRESTSKPVVEG